MECKHPATFGGFKRLILNILDLDRRDKLQQKQNEICRRHTNTQSCSDFFNKVIEDLAAKKTRFRIFTFANIVIGFVVEGEFIVEHLQIERINLV